VLARGTQEVWSANYSESHADLVVLSTSDNTSTSFFQSGLPSQARLGGLHGIRAPVSCYKNHRKLRVALVGAAILAQIHLLFVVELHHHGAQLDLSGGQGQVTAQLTQCQASPKPDAICDACRLCRQGAVQLASSARVPFRGSVASELPATQARKFARLLPSRLSSRAPPLS